MVATKAVAIPLHQVQVDQVAVEHRLDQFGERARIAALEEIGLDVHLEPFIAENEDGCTGCLQVFPEQFKTIYTRKK